MMATGGKRMTRLEKEFYKSYQENGVEYRIKDGVKNFTDEWLKRPEDLDKLVKSDEYTIRAKVVDVGRDKDLDILVKDPSEYVRYAVAMNGRDKDLDRLVHDPDWEVRQAVAEQGREKDLDILVGDPDQLVKAKAKSKMAQIQR